MKMASSPVLQAEGDEDGDDDEGHASDAYRLALAALMEGKIIHGR
jgi:hypothetical protein